MCVASCIGTPSLPNFIKRSYLEAAQDANSTRDSRGRLLDCRVLSAGRSHTLLGSQRHEQGQAKGKRAWRRRLLARLPWRKSAAPAEVKLAARP
eukprot:2327499-Pleurochrysis_carterae.AAC.1